MSLDTLAAAVSHEIEIKHSRFRASAAPVDSADGALEFLKQVAVADATHNCWAFRVGDDYRSNDDGEPAGTAGRPILAAIDGQGYDRVMVVVTRWYGGIKLGAGGLVRAYGGCAAECLRNAPREAIIAYAQAWLAFDFADTGIVHMLLEQHGAEKLEERFETAGPRIRLRLPEHALPALREHLRDATRDRARIGDNG